FRRDRVVVPRHSSPLRPRVPVHRQAHPLWLERSFLPPNTIFRTPLFGCDRGVSMAERCSGPPHLPDGGGTGAPRQECEGDADATTSPIEKLTVARQDLIDADYNGFRALRAHVSAFFREPGSQVGSGSGAVLHNPLHLAEFVSADHSISAVVSGWQLMPLQDQRTCNNIRRRKVGLLDYFISTEK